MLFITSNVFATVILVDQKGAGQYSTIQAGINAALSGDTVRVWPGTYQEQVTLNKDILLEGSGYENSIITSSFNPTVIISSGKIRWFMVTSLAGNGFVVSGGTISNCVIKGCMAAGIYGGTNGGISNVINCVITNNGGQGIISNSNSGCYINVQNCISRNNSYDGFYGSCGYGCVKISVAYSNGSRTSTNGNQECIDIDPLFTSTSDYHLSQGSPCWNKGNPSLQDPDGSICDMGYFGGPDCPIYPVIYEIKITPSGTSINLQAKGRANY